MQHKDSLRSGWRCCYRSTCGFYRTWSLDWVPPFWPSRFARHCRNRRCPVRNCCGCNSHTFCRCVRWLSSGRQNLLRRRPALHLPRLLRHRLRRNRWLRRDSQPDSGWNCWNSAHGSYHWDRQKPNSHFGLSSRSLKEHRENLHS